MAKYYKVFFMPNNQNPNDLKNGNHKMITRSKRKRNDNLNNVFEINDYSDKTLKKMKNSNILFKLGVEWDSGEEDNCDNQMDFDKKQVSIDKDIEFRFFHSLATNILKK